MPRSRTRIGAATLTVKCSSILSTCRLDRTFRPSKSRAMGKWHHRKPLAGCWQLTNCLRRLEQTAFAPRAKCLRVDRRDLQSGPTLTRYPPWKFQYFLTDLPPRPWTPLHAHSPLCPDFSRSLNPVTTSSALPKGNRGNQKTRNGRSRVLADASVDIIF
jgi:hypothetical protein